MENESGFFNERLCRQRNSCTGEISDVHYLRLCSVNRLQVV